MTSESRLLLARFSAALLIIVLATGFILLYEQMTSGMFEETAHRLSTSYNSASSALAGR